MAGVKGSIAIDVQAQLIGSGDLGTPKAPVNFSKLIQFIEGTAQDNEANILWSDERSIAASSTENLDLAGVLADALGATITAAEITGIIIEADDGNTNSVVVFGAASNPFNGPLSGTTPKVTLKPGAVFVWYDPDGVAVTADTGDIILVANSSSGSAVVYKIIIIGRTAAA